MQWLDNPLLYGKCFKSRAYMGTGNFLGGKDSISYTRVLTHVKNLEGIIQK